MHVCSLYRLVLVKAIVFDCGAIRHIVQVQLPLPSSVVTSYCSVVSKIVLCGGVPSSTNIIIGWYKLQRLQQ